MTGRISTRPLTGKHSHAETNQYTQHAKSKVHVVHKTDEQESKYHYQDYGGKFHGLMF